MKREQNSRDEVNDDRPSDQSDGIPYASFTGHSTPDQLANTDYHQLEPVAGGDTQGHVYSTINAHPYYNVSSSPAYENIR